MTVPIPPLPPTANQSRVKSDGTPTQAQIDYERKLSAWVQSYTSSLVTGIPFPSPTTLGGVLSATALTHQFQRGIDTAGNPLFAQPAAGDISGLGSLATANTVAVGSITGLGSLATLSSIDLATQATGNLGVSHLNSGIDANSSTFLRGDGTWASPTAVPGGTSGQIQFNSAGSFGGFTVGGDGTLDPVTGLLAVTKTGGAAFATIATAGISVGLLLPSTIFTISGSPVTGSGTLTGTLANQPANNVFAGATSGGSSQPTFRQMVGADLPTPTSSSLGGIQSKAAVSSQWINSISTAGVPSLSQPAFSDISGTASATQGGTAQSTYTLGDLLYSSAANTLAKLAGNITTTKKYLSQTGTGTVSAAPAWAQIAAADLSNGTTGSGAVALAFNPTFTGTLTAASINATLITATSAGFTNLTAQNSSGAFAKLTNTTNTGQLALSGTGNDEGAYLLGYETNSFYEGSGATYDGSIWTAKATTASILGNGSGVLVFFSNSGLTVGNTFTPTLRFGIDATGTMTAGTVPVARLSGLATSAIAGTTRSTWTPNDASGAGLTLTVGEAFYETIGNFTVLVFNITYPVTANGSNALVGGLPTACDTSGLSADSLAGGSPSYTNVGQVFTCIINSSKQMAFAKLDGLVLTNANLSGKMIRATLPVLTN